MKYIVLLLIIISFFIFKTGKILPFQDSNQSDVIKSINTLVYKSPEKDLISCQNLESFQQTYCYIGHYFYKFKNTTGSDKERIRQLLETVNEMSAVDVGFIGLGMGLASLKDQTQVQDLIQNKFSLIRQQLMADGFGYAQIINLKKTINQSIDACELLSEQDLRNVCYFGIGRALLHLSEGKNYDLRPLDQLDLTKKNWIIKGHGFSYGHADFESRFMNDTFQRGQTLGKVVRLMLQDPSINFQNKIESGLKNCIDRGFYYALCFDQIKN